jgi:hypothetical protein
LNNTGSTVRLPLRRHPASSARGVSSAAVSFRRTEANRLILKFRLVADASSALWPAPAQTASRRDELWRSTCCEAFVSASSGPGYREWNFAPSGDWQCYAFESPRTGRSIPAVSLPALDVYDSKSRPDSTGSGAILTEWRLRCEFDVPAGALQLGLSMVVADSQRGLDYWALAHTAATPDFHARDSWTVRV